jgi:putative ABC transport system permease protein
MLTKLSELLHLIGLGIRGLWLHKLRSFLTMLGMIFGVASVIIMLAVGEGASFEAQQQIQALGARNIIARSVKPPMGARERSQDDSVLMYGLTYDDLDRIRETIPTVVAATPQREFRQEIRRLDRRMEGRVAGVDATFLSMNGLTISEGRFLTSRDDENFQNVCVIGSEIAEQLFPFDSPIGKAIRVGPRHYYKVVGVTGRRAASAGIGSSLAAHDYNSDVYLPLSTDRIRFGELLVYGQQGSFTFEKLELSQITVEVSHIDQVRSTASVLESLLGQFHPKEDFSVTVPLELLDRAKATQRIFNLVLGSTAAISLLVGGIGIMNIMLATVTERTREIGIRRALGANRWAILRQFLVETLVLSLTGSLVGIGLGLAAPPLVTLASGIRTIVSLWSVIAALGVALGVGIASGIYPAIHASRLDPIEALRAD